MTTNVQRTAGIPRATTAALVLAVFTVSVGYGVVLPLLPDLVEVQVMRPSKALQVITRLLVLTFIVSAGIGVFEVGLALRGRQELNLTSYQVALMFTECSLVTFAAQAVAFSPWIKANTTRWIAGHPPFRCRIARDGMTTHRRRRLHATRAKTTSRRTPLMIVTACALIWPPANVRLRGGE